MNIEKSVERLFRKAQSEGCDGPTEQMVIDAIQTITDEQYNDICWSLEDKFPGAAKALRNWKALAYSQNRQPV